MKERNEIIKQGYIKGKTLKELSQEFELSPVRIWQILKAMNVSFTQRNGGIRRTRTITTHVTSAVKEALEKAAEEAQVSISEYVNSLIENDFVAKGIAISDAPKDHPRLPLED